MAKRKLTRFLRLLTTNEEDEFGRKKVLKDRS